MYICFQYMLDIDFTYYNTKYSDIDSLREDINKFFADKTYCPIVDELTIGLYCGIIIWPPLVRPRYIEDKKFVDTNPHWEWSIYHQLRTDVIIEDKDALLHSDRIGGYTIIARAIIDYFQKHKMPLKIRKTFETERFINDLKSYFISIGCNDL